MLAATFFAALASLIPIGASGTDAGLVAHLALAPIFAASITERIRIGPVGAFVAGFIVDVLTLTPLGVCAASYLAFQGVTMRESQSVREVPIVLRWLFFALLAGAVAVLHIAAMMLVAGGEPLRFELGISLVATCLTYPILSCVFRLTKPNNAGSHRRIQN
ncbi:MAG: hypothetical protein HKN60_09380 [Rhizobiales bacterium]|nr:hypothetical protein [Hyphomicrobiales bacterium]